jgi:hypothetical protein
MSPVLGGVLLPLNRAGAVSRTFRLYGKARVKTYKTFLATWRPAGGAIRVVLMDDQAPRQGE